MFALEPGERRVFRPRLDLVFWLAEAGQTGAGNNFALGFGG